MYVILLSQLRPEERVLYRDLGEEPSRKREQKVWKRPGVGVNLAVRGAARM